MGIPARAKIDGPFDFRDQVGFYALYDNSFQLVYFGQAGRGNDQTLYGRLKKHTRGNLSGRWSRFSWFGIKYVKANGKLSAKAGNIQGKQTTFLDQTEAIVLSVAEPPNNLQGGRFGDAVQYRQYRDVEKLGPSPNDMIAEIYEKLGKE